MWRRTKSSRWLPECVALSPRRLRPHPLLHNLPPLHLPSSLASGQDCLSLLTCIPWTTLGKSTWLLSSCNIFLFRLPFGFWPFNVSLELEPRCGSVASSPSKFPRLNPGLNPRVQILLVSSHGFLILELFAATPVAFCAWNIPVRHVEGRKGKKKGERFAEENLLQELLTFAHPAPSFHLLSPSFLPGASCFADKRDWPLWACRSRAQRRRNACDGSELSAARHLSPDGRLRSLCMCENRKRGIESPNLSVADHQEPDDTRTLPWKITAGSQWFVEGELQMWTWVGRRS